MSARKYSPVPTIKAETFAFPVLSSLPCQIKTVQPLPRTGINGHMIPATMLTDDVLVAVSVSHKLLFSMTRFAHRRARPLRPRAGTQFHVYTF